MSRNPRIVQQNPDSGDVCQAGREIRGILGPPGCLLGESLHLSEQDRGLPFGHPEVASEDRVLVPAARLSSPDIVYRPDSIGNLLVVREDDSALAGIQVLARLEAERSAIADR